MKPMNIETLISTLDKIRSLEDCENQQLIHLSSETGDIRIDELSKMPVHINVITIAAVGKLKETAHSLILQNLLQHPSILDSFIKKVVGISDFNLKPKDIRPAEQDRIDLSIFGRDICIIIENKVNNAPEQPSQIYRYVKFAMDEGYESEQIKVLYLNSNHHCKPSDFSLTDNGQRIPKEIEDSLVVKDYAHDIYNWIKELPAIIPKDQKYITSALYQYKDYLEDFFYLNDKYAVMKERIKNSIITNILTDLSDTNDSDYSKRIKVLDEAAENLQQLLDGINELANEYSVKQDRTHIKAELEKTDKHLMDLTPYGYDELNSGVKIELNGKTGYIAYGYGDKEYIGFAFETSMLTKSEISYLNRMFKRFGKENYGEEDLWPCWNYIGSVTLLNEFSNFVNFVQVNSKKDDKFQIEFI